jgi:hypothetical protein
VDDDLLVFTSLSRTTGGRSGPGHRELVPRSACIGDVAAARVPRLVSLAARLVLVALLAISRSGGSAARGASSPSSRPAIPTDAPITDDRGLVKTAGTVVAIEEDRLLLRITDRNLNARTIWNNRTVAVVVTARTVFPGLGVQRIGDAHLVLGQEVTFTFIPAEYDTQLGAYPALVIGRETIQ